MRRYPMPATRMVMDMHARGCKRDMVQKKVTLFYPTEAVWVTYSCSLLPNWVTTMIVYILHTRFVKLFLG